MSRETAAGALVAALVSVTVIVVPGSAVAKTTCQHRGLPGAEGGFTGLPTEPGAGETYTVTIATGRPPARREGPGIVLLERGHRMPPKVTILDCSGRDDGLRPGDVEEFPATPTGELGEYTADVRFPSVGKWAMSVYGLRPAYRDLGMHRVLPRVAAVARIDSAAALPPKASWPLVAGAAALLSLAAGWVIPRQRSRRRALLS